MQLKDITPDSLFLAFLVVLALLGAYITVMNAIKTWREEKQRKDMPVNELEETVKGHTDMLRRDNDRLKELEEGNRIMMRAMMALLSHDINGNSSDKLKEAMDEIQRYLIER
jgi:hypothetical protein